MRPYNIKIVSILFVFLLSINTWAEHLNTQIRQESNFNFKTDNRNAANGYMTITIQSNGKNEPIKVKLISEGLESTEINL